MTAIVLIWIVNTVFSAARSRILDIALPALTASKKISHKIASIGLPKNRLIKENESLKEAMSAIKNKLAQFDEISLENNRLKKLLGFKTARSYKSTPAQVIGRDPSNWTSVIYINKGSDDGIKKYMAVSAARGLVGRVIEAGSSTAKIMFLTDPDSRIGVVVQRTRHDGLLYGTLSRQCQMVYLSLNADVWPGDVVVSSGLGGSIPGGIMVGTIEDVFVDKSGLYQAAIVKLAVDLSRVEEVLCIE